MIREILLKSLIVSCLLLVSCGGGGGSSGSSDQNQDGSHDSEGPADSNPAPVSLNTLNLSWKNGKIPMTMSFTEEAVSGMIDDGSGTQVPYRGRYQYIRSQSVGGDSILIMQIEYVVESTKVKKKALLDLKLKFAGDGAVSISGKMVVSDGGPAIDLPPSSGDLEQETPPAEDLPTASAEWNTLSVGSLLEMDLIDQSGNHLTLSCGVSKSGGKPAGKVVFNHDYSSDENTDFSFQKSGQNVELATSFKCMSSFGDQKVDSTYSTVQIRTILVLSEKDASQEKQPSSLSGNCSFNVTVSQTNGISVNEKTYSGSGTFSIKSGGGNG